MKRLLFILAIALLASNTFAQKGQKYTEEDAKQFYRTIQGDYTAQPNDSTTLSVHFTPIWEREDDRFHWLYLEASNGKEIIEQKIIEIVPVSDINFKVCVYKIKNPELFAGKWGNRNFFDGFNSGILKGKKTFHFLKTKDFEYQTGWSGRKSLKCFPSDDRIHFKFVQEDERLYVTRALKSSHLISYTFFKALTD